MNELNCLTCHIVGLNPVAKNKLINTLDKKTFNTIDLDDINQTILLDKHMDTLFKQYTKLKEHKNDKFKEIDKKMSFFWESKFLDIIAEKIKPDRKNILIGQNNHYRYLARRVNLQTSNKFVVPPTEQDIKDLIAHNLENHKNDIINGSFPIELLDHEFLMKKWNGISDAYKKTGYLEKDFEQIEQILKLLSTKKEHEEGLWIAMKESYNVGSKIHPKKNDKLIAYTDNKMALLGTFNFEKGEISKSFTGKQLKLKELKPLALDKLREKRFLYYVNKDSFIPHEKGANKKFFSQMPINILHKEKINSVYDYIMEQSEEK
jgi:hypothetical protein